MKRLRFLGMIALAGLLLTSCASVAHIEKDETVNFSNFKTYAWVDATDAIEDKKGNDLQEQKVRQAVNAELSKQGWREAKTKPDVLLSYDVLVEKSIVEATDPVYSRPYTRMFFNPYTRRWNSIYFPSQFLGYDRNQYAVREGTLTISIIDAKTDKTIWQGWTTDEVNSANLTGKEIQNGVRSIFRKFDVAKK